MIIIERFIIIMTIFSAIAIAASTHSNRNGAKSPKIVEYKVKSGDILYTIAHSHHTTIKEVRELNGLSESDTIRIGQVLKVPLNTYFPDKKAKDSTKKATPKAKTSKDKKSVATKSKKDKKTSKSAKKVAKSSNKSIYHIVKSGESLGSIAHKYGLKTSELKRLNGMKEDDYIIRVGMKLKIAKESESKKSATKSKNGKYKKSEPKKRVAKSKKRDTKEIVKIEESVKVKKETIHRVKRGETLNKIAKRYGVSLKDIRRVNGLKKHSHIRVGQKLKIVRTVTQKRTRSVEVATHRVKKGEKLSTIAKKYGMSKEELLKINKLSKKSKIHKGMKLKVVKKTKNQNQKVAKSKAPKTETKVIKKQVIKLATHRVKRGESLSSIAKKYNMSVDDLRQMNKLSKKRKIHKGMKLKVVKLVTVEQRVEIPKKKSTTKEKKVSKVAKSKPAKKSVERADVAIEDMSDSDIIRVLASNPITPKIKKLMKGDKYYTVGDGDMLFTIARKEHVSLKELMKLNSIGATDIIKPGQKLKIPLTDEEKKLVARAKRVQAKKSKLAKLYRVEKRVTKHKVKRGDTLWKIAKKYGVKISDIRRLNHMSKKSRIHKNMVLVVKRETLVIPKEIKKTYIVKRGDTLWKIAKKYKVSVTDIKRWNKLGKKSVLKKGMKLTLKLPNNRAIRGGRVKSTKKIRVAKKSKSSKKSKKRYASSKKRRSNPMDIFKSHSSNADVIRIAKRYLGKRYVWGAEGPNQFDCSGFTQYVMKKSKGIKIPRISRRQAYYGKYVSRKNLKPGDLIFFDTSRRRRGYVNHVGIYIGNNKFIHASSARHRVVITSLERPFYRARFKWGRRIN